MFVEKEHLVESVFKKDVENAGDNLYYKSGIDYVQFCSHIITTDGEVSMCIKKMSCG